MSSEDQHLPWVEKYRPRRLDDVVNQEEVVATLKNVVATKNVPHMLFAGPPGTGKTATAHAFAQELFGPRYLEDGLFVEINASDERGIETIRERVKTYARTVPFRGIGFRILLLDESDQLTDAAQHAFRRTMEQFSATCRFILAANYSNRIIEPIQSRCAVLRFKPLNMPMVEKMLRRISEAEKIVLDDSAVQAIYEFSLGDMRKAINILQSAASLSSKVDEKTVYKVMGLVSRGEVRRMLELALDGKFKEARDLLRELIYVKGHQAQDIISTMAREIPSLNVSEDDKIKLVDVLGETDYRISQGGTPEVQLQAFLAKLSLVQRAGD
ncbi:MAG: replication factor C small subunit [Candidatus Caldarchaeum sp.]|uniref:Replication factor C small subunit n=1 Tax=Caldiarchaeum subterraneum TaxID=311458 RepID=A0A7C5Q7B8_CALS0